jgi:HD-like signal output (HDOD) protein
MAGGAGTVPALLATLMSPDADPRKVVAAIHNAPGIALRVLKVANSAFYGRVGRVDTMDRAVQVLGLDVVRTMASAACLDRVMPGSDGNGGPSSVNLLNHSLATAVLARDLALLLLPERSADAFLAGLLHDLGYRVVQRLIASDAQGGSAPAADAATLARRWHGACAALVFHSWNLPDWLARVVAFHHEPAGAGAEHERLTRIVAAAEHLADASGHGLALDELSDEPWPLPELVPDGPAVTELRQRWPQSLAALNLALAA